MYCLIFAGESSCDICTPCCSEKTRNDRMLPFTAKRNTLTSSSGRYNQIQIRMDFVCKCQNVDYGANRGLDYRRKDVNHQIGTELHGNNHRRECSTGLNGCTCKWVCENLQCTHGKSNSHWRRHIFSNN